jgi:hypothetical protein
VRFISASAVAIDSIESMASRTLSCGIDRRRHPSVISARRAESELREPALVVIGRRVASIEAGRTG